MGSNPISGSDLSNLKLEDFARHFGPSATRETTLCRAASALSPLHAPNTYARPALFAWPSAPTIAVVPATATEYPK